MKYLTMFFLLVKIFQFSYSKQILFFLFRFREILNNKKQNPKQKQVVIIDKSAIYLIIYLLSDFLFILFCLYLMYHEATWTAGCMLMLIACLESYAVHGKVSGACVIEEDGFVHHSLWARYTLSAMSFFILLQMLKGIY